MLENGPNLQKLEDFAMIPLMLDPLIPLFLLSDLIRLQQHFSGMSWWKFTILWNKHLYRLSQQPTDPSGPISHLIPSGSPNPSGSTSLPPRLQQPTKTPQSKPCKDSWWFSQSWTSGRKWKWIQLQELTKIMIWADMLNFHCQGCNLQPHLKWIVASQSCSCQI